MPDLPQHPRERGVWAQAGLPSGPDDQLYALQLELNQRLGAVALLPESDPDYAAACDRVFAAGLALVGAENRVPVLLAERSHRTTGWVLLGCGLFSVLVGVVVGIAVGWGWLSWWWVVPAALVVAAGVSVVRTPVHPPGGRHVRQRAGAAVVALGAVLLGWLVPAFGLAPGMSGRTAAVLFALAAAAAGLGVSTLRTSVQVHPR